MANLLSWLGGVANDIGGQVNNAAGAVNNFAVRPIQQAQNQAIRNVQRVAQPVANNFAEQAKRTALFKMQQDMARASANVQAGLRQGAGQANNNIGFGIKVAQATPRAFQNVNQPIPGLGVSAPQIAMQLPNATRETWNMTRPAREMFAGGTGQVLNTVKSLPAGVNVFSNEQGRLVAKALGMKELENKAAIQRQKAFEEFARLSQDGINPVGSAQQKAIDQGGVEGLKAFSTAMATKGGKAGLEIAPVVTGAAATVPLKTVLLKGGTLSTAANLGYSGLTGQYGNDRSIQEKAIQAGADVLGGYGGEALGYGISKVAPHLINATRNTAKQAVVDLNAPQVAKNLADKGRLQAEGFTNIRVAKIAGAPSTPSPTTAQNFVHNADGRFGNKNKAAQTEIDLLKQHQREQLIISQRSPNPIEKQGALQNYKVAQDRIDVLENPKVPRFNQDAPVNKNDQITLFRSGGVDVNNKRGIFLSDSEKIAKQYQNVETGIKTTEQYGLSKDAKIYNAKNTLQTFRELKPGTDVNNITDRYIRQQVREGKLIDGLTAEQRTDRYMEGVIKRELSKKGYDGVSYSGGTYDDMAGEYQLFNDKHLKRISKPTEAEVQQKLEYSIDMFEDKFGRMHTGDEYRKIQKNLMNNKPAYEGIGTELPPSKPINELAPKPNLPKGFTVSKNGDVLTPQGKVATPHDIENMEAGRVLSKKDITQFDQKQADLNTHGRTDDIIPTKDNFDSKHFKDNNPDEPFVYHVSSDKNFSSIKENGLKPKAQGNKYDQPSGVYFSRDAETALAAAKSNMVDTKGKVIYRVKADDNYSYSVGRNAPVLDDIEADSFAYRKPIPTSKIEVLTDDGWKPLSNKTSGVDKPIYEMAPKPDNYVYHSTNKSNIDSIKTNGLVPGKSGANGFTNEAGALDYAKTLNKISPEDTSVIRVNKDKIKNVYMQDGSEVFTKDSIPASSLEVKINGKWQPLASNKPIYELAPKPNKIPEVPAKKGIVTETPGPNRSGLSKSMEAKGYKSSTFDDIPGYSRVTNETMLAKSDEAIKNNEDQVMQRLLNRKRNAPISAQENSDAIALMNKFAKNGDDDKLARLARATAANATEAGRAVQILSRLQALTPEGAVVRANKIIDKYNSKFAKNNKDIILTKENESTIIKMAKDIQKLEDGTRDHDVASAMLAKYIDNLVPPSKLAKISSVQTMAQLLNPKTAIRNILGNGVMAVGEDTSTVAAAPIDMLISGLQRATGHKGQRTVGMINPLNRVKGTAQGVVWGTQDALKGIKTSGLAGNFEITTNVFRGAKEGDNFIQAAGRNGMKGAQTLLSLELGAADKAFYNGQFKTSLGSMMRAGKVKKPEKWMLQQADAEALYSTFQNNSKIAEALSGTKKWLNVQKEWGLGDIVVKYPKTPGNIVSVGLDYSPVGAFKGILSLVKNWGRLDKVTQREAARNIGRGIVGTGAIGLGAMLAYNKIITGKKSSDKDMAAIDRQQGDGPFTFNFTALQRLVAGESTDPQPGDVIANYDWMQPSAIALSMGANAVLNGGAKQKKWENIIGDALEAVGDSVNTVVEQPVLTGVSRFVNTASSPDRGGGVGTAFANLFQGVPASFTPGILNQIGQLTDNTARSTYDPNFFKTGLNQIKSRLPVLRETLQPRIDTMGNVQEQYADGGNNAFNVFFNPAFVKTFKTSPAYDLINGIFKNTGDSQQAPRITQNQVTVNGEKRDLTPEESTKYQQYVGQITKQTFERMGTDPAFLALPDSEKASRMASAMTKINAGAMYALFGDRSDKASGDNTARRVANSGKVDYSTAADGSMGKISYKDKYEQERTNYEQDKKDGIISEVDDIRRSKALKKLSAQAKFDDNTNELYGLSNAELDTYLKSKPNGGNIYNNLVALDDALVAQGFTSKFKDKYGSKKRLAGATGGKGRKGRKGTGKKKVAQLPNLVKSGMFKSSKIVTKGTPTSKLSVKSLPKVSVGKNYA